MAGANGLIPFILVKHDDTLAVASGHTTNCANSVGAVNRTTELLKFLSAGCTGAFGSCNAVSCVVILVLVADTKVKDLALKLMSVFKIKNEITARTHITSFRDLAGWGPLGLARGGPTVQRALMELLDEAATEGGEVVSVTALRSKVCSWEYFYQCYYN